MDLVGSATWILRVYGVLAITHLLLQYRYALGHQWRLYREKVRGAERRGVAGHRYSNRYKRIENTSQQAHSKRMRVRDAKKLQQILDTEPMPTSIAVWVTVYQETPELLRDCLRSLANQAFSGRLRFLVSDDGSYSARIAKYSAPQPRLGQKRWWFFHCKVENYAKRLAFYRAKRAELEAVFDEFRSDSRFVFILSRTNEGKREAQQKAWVRSHGGYTLYASVDSDTALAPNALRQLASNFRNPDVAAATGYVDVRNAKRNLLTRLIDQRYWHAFHVERAAQSYHMSVMCCSGPLAAYRATVVDQVMGRYVTQRFLNRFCTFGDDRHLTNLVLALGYLVVMDPRAHCLTEVPTTLRQYIKQQTRWNKSFYREMLWTTGAIRSHSWYMTYDLTMQFLLPFLLVAALIATVILTVSGGGFATVLLYLATVFGIGFVRSLYGAIMRRQVSYMLFMLYGPIYICVLMPVRWYALITLLLGKTHWGTRDG